MADDPISIDDFHDLARKRLSRPAYDYYASGANDEVTLRRNRAAYEEIRLHYRVLADVTRRTLATTVLGTDVSMPVLLAPTAFHRMAHPDGELASARAASAESTLMCLSTLSTTSLEAVADESTGPLWFQLYVYKDRGATMELIERAEAAGYRALVFTVDAPYLGVRERDVRNRFSLPEGLSVENLTASQMAALPAVAHESGLAAYFQDLLEPGLTWETVDWIASQSNLPIILKGVVRADDARRAAEHGASAIVVSNHGGRQLDTSPATIEVVSSVAEAVGDEVEVYLDGGIRRGTDIVKALARGARAVFVGRPVLWGLAVDGEAGVRSVLSILRAELDLAMALCGVAQLSDIGPWLLEPEG